MPIFEYKCNKCGQIMEFLEKTTGLQKHKCIKCNSLDLQKMLSGFAVGQNKSKNLGCDACPSEQCQAIKYSGGSCPY